MKVKGTILIVCGFLLVATLLTRSARLTPEKDTAMAQQASRSLASGGNQHLSLQVPAANTPRVSEAYDKLPLSFEVNQGQTDAQVKFVSRGQGYALFLTSTEAVFALHKPEPSRVKGLLARKAAGRHGTRTTASVMRVKLVGANPVPQVVGLDALPGKSNYFVGNDPGKWRTDVPSFAKVKYEGIYPGVDLIYYGNQHQLENDFVLAPGANPKTITLDIQAPGRLRIDPHGDLVVNTADGQVRLRKPLAYQEQDGLHKAVPAKFVLKGEHQVGFEVARYDAAKPLTIDPVLFYSTYLGGSANDSGHGIAVDSAGNAYVTGATLSANFPVKGPIPGTGSAMSDAFVTKIDTTKSGAASLIYSTYLGGSADDAGSGIAIDPAGNAYITGLTASSSNFPVTSGTPGTVTAFQQVYGGGLFDAFLTKINPAGNALVYSTYLGGSDDDEGNGIAVDANGVAYVTGVTASVNFPVSLAPFLPFQAAFSGVAFDAFVTKIDTTKPGATGLIYSTYLGGNSDDEALGIAIDNAGNAYVAGFTASSNFPVKAAFQNAFNGGAIDAFVTKINTGQSGANSLVYSTYLGGSGDDLGFAIAADSSGKAYVTGSTTSSNFPTSSGSFQTAFNLGAHDAFVAKLDTTQSGTASRVYATYLGGSGDDQGFGIAIDAAGNAFVTGQTSSSDFPKVAPFQAAYGGGTFDAFVTSVNTTGSALVYSSYLGGSLEDDGLAIAVDSAGSAYVTGQTASGDFPKPRAFQTALGGGTFDAFVAKVVTAPLVSLAPATLTFASQNVGSTSASQTVTLTNTGGSNLTVTSVVAAGDFAQTNTCITATIAPGATCTITVTFTPTAGGARTGTITITSNALGSPQVITLTGTGADFSISVSPTSATVKAGQPATYTITVTPNGFTGTVTLSCSGAPTLATCSVTPASVTLSGTTAQTATATLTTTAPSMVVPMIRVLPPTANVRFGLRWMPLIVACGILVALALARRRRVLWLVPGTAMVVLLLCLGCGGGGPKGGTPAGTSTLTFTGTSGSVSHSTTAMLTVQ